MRGPVLMIYHEANSSGERWGVLSSTSRRPITLSNALQRRTHVLVRKEGFEPPRPFGHKILSLARLPVPPLPHGCVSILSIAVPAFHQDFAMSTAFTNGVQT